MQGWKLAAALAAIALLGPGAAHAGGEAPEPPSPDATRGYLGLELTRLAIFDGRVADARRLIHEAADAFEKAKGDRSVFTKAESELRPARAVAPAAAPAAAAQSPAEAEAEAAAMNRAKQENSAKVWAGAAPNDAAAAAFNSAAEERAAAASNAAKQETSARVYAGDMPLRWLPVDAEMGLPRDFAAGAQRQAAVAEADQKLATGDRPGALATLKAAGMRLETVMGVMPLDQSLADIRQAATLIDSGKYLEASQLLRHVQDGVRYDASHLSMGGAAGR